MRYFVKLDKNKNSIYYVLDVTLCMCGLNMQGDV